MPLPESPYEPDYDPNTNEYINGWGARTKISAMSDQHLQNTIRYLERRHNGKLSDACLAMQRKLAERTSSLERGSNDYPALPASIRGYAIPPPTIPYIVDNSVPPGEMYEMYMLDAHELDNATAMGMAMLRNQLTKENTMAKGLYEVAILQDTEDKTELVHGPVTYVAGSGEAAKLAAVAEYATTNQHDKVDVTEGIRVIVRQFGPSQA